MAENEKNPPNSQNPNHPKSDSDSDSMVDLGATESIQLGASGVIPLSDLPKSGSSASVFSWADIIGQTPSSSQTDEQNIKFDSTSDKDLLQKIVEEEQAAGRIPPALPVPDSTFEGTVQSSSHPQSDPTIFGGTLNPSGSSVRLDEPIVKHGAPSSGSVVRFEMPKGSADIGPESEQNFVPPPIDSTSPEMNLPPVPEVQSVTEMQPSYSSFSRVDGTDPELPLFEQEGASVVPPMPLSHSRDQDSSPDILSAQFIEPTNEDGSMVVLTEQTPQTPRPGVEHSSILDILLGEEEIAEAFADDARPSERIHLDQPGGEPPLEGAVSLGGGGEKHPPSTQDQMPLWLPEDILNAPGTSSKSEFIVPGSQWNTPGSAPDIPPLPSTKTPPDFADPVKGKTNDFNAEDSVDLYSDSPIGTGGVSESGSLHISQAEIDAAQRKAKMMESSAVDLSSHPSLAGIDLDADQDLPSFTPTPSMEDIQFPGDDGGTAATAMQPQYMGGSDDGSINLDLPDISEDGSRITQPGELVGRMSDTDQQRLQGSVRARQNPVSGSQFADRSSQFEMTPAPRGSSLEEESVPPYGGNYSPPKKGGTLVGGLVGLAVGVVIFGAVYILGVIPNGSNSPSNSGTGPSNKNGSNPPKLVAATAADAQQMLDSGNLGKAMEIFNSLENKTPAVLAGKGRTQWRMVLQEATKENKPIAPNDPMVQQSISDLQTAADTWVSDKSPEAERDALLAVISLGYIQEKVGDPTAEQTYAKYKGEFSTSSQKVLETAQKRLKVLRQYEEKKEKESEEMGRLDPQEAFLIFAILLQDPTKNGETKAKDSDAEAGAYFWRALESAQEKNYNVATAVLKKAIEAHKAQRALNPTKGLNPLTDPGEQIFEIACMELISLWNTKKSDPVDPSSKEYKEIVDNLSDLLKTDRKKLSQAIATIQKDNKGLTDLQSKLLEEIKEKSGIKKDDLQEAIAELISSSGGALKTVKAVEDALKDAGINNPKLPDTIQTVAKDIKEKAKTITGLQGEITKKDEAIDGLKGDVAKKDTEIDGLKKDTNDKGTTITEVAKLLKDAGWLGDKVDRTGLLEGVRIGINKAASGGGGISISPTFAAVTGAPLAVHFATNSERLLAQFQTKVTDLTGNVNQLKTDLANKDQVHKKALEVKDTQLQTSLAAKEVEYKNQLTAAEQKWAERLAAARSPEETLETVFSFMANPTSVNESKLALQQMDLLRTKKLTPEQEAKVASIRALALRNLEQFDEARKAFATAISLPGFDKEKWGKNIFTASLLLNSPEQFVGIAAFPPMFTDPKVDVAKVETALKAFPKDTQVTSYSRLLALRSLVKLDAGDFPGALSDAEAAIAAQAIAEGNFAKAKLLERQEQYPQALLAYGETLKNAINGSALHKEAQIGDTRIRLIQIGLTNPPKTEPKTESGPTLKQTKTAPGEKLSFNTISVFDYYPLVLTESVLADPEKPESKENERLLQEATKLIDEKNYNGYFLRAQALANKGDYKAALAAYIDGLRFLEAVPKDYDKTLQIIVEKLGVQTQSDPTVARENPDLADREFNEGYSAYFRNDFVKAQFWFLRAISHGQDARYTYFLALSIYKQGRDAERYFNTASELERMGKPNAKLINTALERVQGETRRVLELKRP
jgi:tetratricopeptide (TPR) repeat protein